MASPFSVFRKNQKILMAVFGVAAMIAFVFLGPLSQYMGGGRPEGGNPVVVETKYGDYKQSELEGLEYQRQLVDRFIESLVAASAGKQFSQPGMDNRWAQQIAQQQYMMWHNRIMEHASGGPEQQAIESMLMAEKAKQMGLVVSDQTINDMIGQISSFSLTAAEIQDIIRRLQPQRPISVARLFEAFRNELLAMQYYQFFVGALADVAPAQRFEYFSRLNRQVKSEVLPLAVADFVSQAPEPTDAEVKEFYEKFKNAYPDPTSPDPGFNKPKRASFQYFKAPLDSLAESLKGEVTEEEIAKFYEENKQRFPVTGLSGPGAALPAAAPPAQTPGEAAPAAETTAEEKPANGAPAEEKPATETPAEEKPEQTPAEEKPADAPAEQPAETPAATETPAEQPTPEEKPAEGEAAPAESPQAKRAMKSVFRFASMQEEKPAEEAPAAEAPATETPADAAPAAETPAAETPVTETPAETPAAEAPAADKPAEEKPAEEKPAAADKPAAPGDEVVAEPAVPEVAPQFEPLEKVKDQIRDMLAMQKAEDKVRAQFEELSGQMKRYSDEFDIYSVEKQTNAKAIAPQPLDFNKLAEGKNVEVGELKSVTPLQALKSDFGKSFRLMQGGMPGQTREVPLVQFAFADNLPEYRAEVTQDGENNAYLFWKTSEEPAYVPPLDEIRAEVVQAWKLTKARDLAKKRGEEYAEQARTQKKSLAELFGSQPNAKVSEPAPFSWLTLGNVPQQQGAEPRLSEVDGVDQAGPAFMQAVFALPTGGVGVAFNQPQDVLYVIRAIEFTPSEEQLRDDFARENPARYLSAGREDQRVIFRNWLAELNSEADVHWVRQADRRRATAVNEGEL